MRKRRMGCQRLVLLMPLCLIFAITLRAQWHTSTNADSALYVCPGFNQGILAFDDGSSIICGALSDSRYVQKLDPYGYAKWAQPVHVYNTPGTNNSGGAMSMISDGDGGVILWWGDYRGAKSISDGVYTRYLNNAVYMQHIDRTGIAQWGSGGMLVDSVQGGLKFGYGVSDGVGGIILYMSENFCDTATGATVGARSWLVRYDSSGQMNWAIKIDTSNTALYVGQPVKLGSRVEIRTLNGARFIDPDSGAIQTPPGYSPAGTVITYRDSIGYDLRFEGYAIDSLGITHLSYGSTGINALWDSVWHVDFKIDDEGDGSHLSSPTNSAFVTDQRGGLFYVWTYKNQSNVASTRAHWITSRGLQWGNSGLLLAKKTCSATFNGMSRLGIYFSDGMAQVFDTAGRALWDTGIVVISNPLDAYSPTIASDNNGGAILAFWTTFGGIYAQHTGRTGKVGVITKVLAEEPIPANFELFQNYPNPFNPTTKIQYEVTNNQSVTLKVYDVLGREIQTLVNERLQRGRYQVVWDASKYASGVYYCTLNSQNRSLTIKMILLR